MIKLENVKKIASEQEAKRTELINLIKEVGTANKGKFVYIEQEIDLCTRKAIECDNFEYALNNNQDLAKVARQAKHEEEARRAYLIEWYEKYLNKDQEVATYIQKAIKLIDNRIAECEAEEKELEA